MKLRSNSQEAIAVVEKMDSRSHKLANRVEALLLYIENHKIGWSPHSLLGITQTVVQVRRVLAVCD
jgi:hypothetical protein